MGCTTRSAWLRRLGATQAEIARVIGCSESTASRKVSGVSPWLLREALAIQSYVQRHYGIALGLRELENGGPAGKGSPVRKARPVRAAGTPRQAHATGEASATGEADATREANATREGETARQASPDP